MATQGLWVRFFLVSLSRRSLPGPRPVLPIDLRPSSTGSTEASSVEKAPGLRVARLTTTPVKSTTLHFPNEVLLTESGVYENRRFVLVEGEGKFISLSRVGVAVQLKFEYDRKKEILSLALPSGEKISDSATNLLEETMVDIYGREVPGKFLKDPKWETSLSQFFGKKTRLFRVADSAVGVDCDMVVSLVSTASVESLKEVSELASDSRRFRMLIEVEGCEIAFEEDTWLGRNVRIGEAEVLLERECPRCEATTKNPVSGTVDNNTLKDIVSLRGKGLKGAKNFGVYGSVTKAGVIKVGDLVEPL